MLINKVDTAFWNLAYFFLKFVSAVNLLSMKHVLRSMYTKFEKNQIKIVEVIDKSPKLLT